MSKAREHEVLILAFGELPDDEWATIVAKEEVQLREALDEIPNKHLDASVEARDIGRGADWMVLGFYFAMAALALPEAHKKVRAHIEEWRRIYNELHGLFSRVVGKRRALFPDEYMFLVAVEHLIHHFDPEQLEYKSVARLPEPHPDLQGREPLLFSFGSNSNLVQVAVSREGKVLWDNQVAL